MAYIEEKIAVVNSEPHPKAARTFLAALKGDWKLPVKRKLAPKPKPQPRPRNCRQRGALKNGRKRGRKLGRYLMSSRNHYAAGRERMQHRQVMHKESKPLGYERFKRRLKVPARASLLFAMFPLI